MSNTIQIKRSSTAASVPTAGQLAVGELAVNLADKKLFTKDASNAVVELTKPDPTNGFSFRNRIINGDMRIDQRNAGASVSYAAGASGYNEDRWNMDNSTDGAVTVQQSTVAPTGFVNSLLVTVSTADSSLASGQRCRIFQRVEGFNCSDFLWGSANAQTVTISFWVRSSLTGTFGGALRNASSNRSYAFTYSISAANTWEYKTVNVAGDTTGTWATGNTSGIEVGFGLGAASDLSGTAGTWTATANVSATGAVSVVGTTGATFYITGVQLEAGSVATPFERRPYGTELVLCQRYYQKSYSQTVVPATVTFAGAVQWVSTSTNTQANYQPIRFPVVMRAAPTVTLYSTVTGTSGRVRNFQTSTDLTASCFDAGDAGTFIQVATAPAATGQQLQAQYVAEIEL
jgi:hypothetical protein